MFKLTCFCPVESDQLEKLLKRLGFSPKKNGLEWYIDGIIFRIEPFHSTFNQIEKGYRVYFNGHNIMSFSYLFDLSLGTLNTNTTCIEYVLSKEGTSTTDWLRILDKNPTLQVVDTRGFYQKGKINLIAVNDTVILQLRSKKNEKLKLIDGLRKIDEMVEEITPVTYDLFSFEEELA